MSEYALITPLRDEAANLGRISACVAGQTRLPAVWVLVENGSTDSTREIVVGLAEQHEWIHLVTVRPPAAQERGAPIVFAFHRGLEALDVVPAMIGQLDADLTFRPDYFERLSSELEANDRLGIVSGSCFEQRGGVWRERFGTGASVWGAARLYRRACLEDVLPLEPRNGWDAIDVAEANARGWQTRVLRDVPFYHHRREAERERTRWSAWAAQGRVSHYLGYRPSYLLLRAAFRAMREPAALGLVAGYAEEAIRRRPQCTRNGVRAWIRRQQRLRNLALRAGEARGRADRDSVV